jgi:hypothetical protein
MWVSSGVLVLILAAASLLALACFQARDVFRSDRDWEREMRRYRSELLSRIPRRERLSLSDRMVEALKRLDTERAQWHDTVEDLTAPRDAFHHRVRAEIDKLVGKDVYHGQKEQL